jgi:endonuclease/exonuclease/phosphatase family metal-dependent hydrolase
MKKSGVLRWALLWAAVVTLMSSSSRVLAAGQDVVIYASDVATLTGNWTKASTSGAAGGQALSSVDNGWSTVNAPLAAPADYFEASFSADAGTPYRVWVRLQGANNSKWNESVWLQFGDATDTNGSAIYRVGTTSGLLVNLENCSGCGVSSWGWQGGAYWLSQQATIKFPTTGSHTIRVQTREDGVKVDQIVLSPATYFTSSPGRVSNDTAIVPKPAAQAPPSSSPTAYTGTAVSIPGKVYAANFDNGADGVAYHDGDTVNTGGEYRLSTGVDIESASEGGYDIGWIGDGEWVNYSVNVTATGSYTAQLRVAAPSSGGSLHLGFNGSNVWTVVSVPATGWWQTWTTVNVPVNLTAGQQLMTVLFDRGGYNLAYVNLVANSVPVPPPPPPPPPPTDTGTQISALNWNILITIYTEAHAREAMAAAIAVSPRPQIITIQESWSNFFPAYIDELQRRTGQTWYGVYQYECKPGAWNGSTCTEWWDQVNGILSTFPIVDSSAIFLPYMDCYASARTALRAALNVNGKIVQTFTTHLQTGGCSDVATARYNSMSMIKSWAANFSTPQIFSGDFNADPDQIASTRGMSPNFVETFALVGTGSRFTFPNWAPTMKLDYWFTDASMKAQPVSSEVITSTGSVSDHWPVRTTFLIR